MSEPENFLERWSRRKREAVDVEEAPQPPKPAGEDAPPVQAVPPDRGDTSKAIPPQTPELEPKFDLASLPPIDSITAATDVRAFLAPGVPRELMHAALRRAWAADPAIRDFVGLAENAWDFTDPTAMPGFGELPPGYDLRKLVAEVFGESGRAGDQGVLADRTAVAAATAEPSQLAQHSQAPAAMKKSTPGTHAPPHDEADQVAVPNAHSSNEVADQMTIQSQFVQHSKNIASQSKNIASQDENRDRRKHGGALPE